MNAWQQRLIRFAKHKSQSIQRGRRRALGTESLEARCMLSMTGSITGAVFVDASNDGVLDATEVGLANIKVSLWGVDRRGNRVSSSQTTDEIGRYAFQNLIAGVYIITETQPSSYFDGADQVGSAGGVANRDRFFLRLSTDEQQASGYYFGELAPATLRGFTYLDKDRDGNFDFLDDSLNGIQVNLSGTNDLGKKVKETVSTGKDGSYRFTGLRPGTYEISADQTDEYADGRETLGTFGNSPNPIDRNGTMTNDKFSSIQLHAGEEGYNYNFGELDEAYTAGILATTFDTTVTFTGTSDVDKFEFIAGTAEHTVVLNGETFSVDAAVTTLVTFYGQGGDDIVQLTGLSSKDEVEFRDTSAKFTGVSYRVLVYSSPFITALSGGGEDRAMFYDTAGDERFEASPLEGRISGDGFEHSAHSFHRVYAYASGGSDVAVLRDSKGDDAFKATPSDARMSGSGFYNYTKGFDRVDAYAEMGGSNDRAYFYDSSGSDTLESSATVTRLYSTQFDNAAHSFDRTYAFSSSGDDSAYFYDTLGSDYFKVDEFGARMYGDGYYNRAVDFATNMAYFTADAATDRSLLACSSGNDSMKAAGTVAEVTRAGLNYTVELVDKMKVVAGLGTAKSDIGKIDFVLETEGEWTAV